ncbi:MAG: hypothetical protein ACJATA_002216 [Sphingobacteriales bacterium]|jgi:hypothetical protein
MGSSIKHKDRFFNIRNLADFEKLALEQFLFQATTVPIYAKYLDHLKIDPKAITKTADIPYLPIQFFKNHRVATFKGDAEVSFQSSSTTGKIPSKHHLKSTKNYKDSIIHGFERRFGNIDDFEFFGLLPGYLERPNASLVFMFNHLMEVSGQAEKHFYLDDFHKMEREIQDALANGKKVFLIGVTHALLRFAEKGKLSPDVILCETGGMKGHGRELIREELHDMLYEKLGVKEIISEYGMTELLSQAWLNKQGRFVCPRWMKVSLREVNDPLSPSQSSTGVLNVIDLANIESCSFIATDDLGRLHSDGSFAVLGRLDNAETRGCNLMI